MRRGRYSRGYLPHVDEACATQFLTWRLADSLPREVLSQWDRELCEFPAPEAKGIWQRRIEKFLDQGFGSCVLGKAVAAQIVQDELIAGHGLRYQLHAWCIMPTHVHVVLTPLPGFPLARVLQLIKGRSSRAIGKRLMGPKPLWQPDYYDRIIRDEAHFDRVVAYIEWNPVKAGLVSDPTLFYHSSASPAAWDQLRAAGVGLKSDIPVAE